MNDVTCSQHGTVLRGKQLVLGVVCLKVDFTGVHRSVDGNNGRLTNALTRQVCKDGIIVGRAFIIVLTRPVLIRVGKGPNTITICTAIPDVAQHGADCNHLGSGIIHQFVLAGIHVVGRDVELHVQFLINLRQRVRGGEEVVGLHRLQALALRKRERQVQHLIFAHQQPTDVEGGIRSGDGIHRLQAVNLNGTGSQRRAICQGNGSVCNGVQGADVEGSPHRSAVHQHGAILPDGHRQ